MDNFEVIFDGRHSRAICFNSKRKNLFVNFDHMRVGKDGFESPRNSEYLSKTPFGQLVVQTAANDWYLNSDRGDLCDALSNFCGERQDVVSISFSMGGYAALLFSHQLNLSRVLLVSPQFSPFPDIAPFDQRYSNYFRPCDPWSDTHFLPRNVLLEGHVAFDPSHRSKDADHAHLICLNFPRILPVELEGGGHPCTKKISASGNYRRLQRRFTLNTLTDQVLRHLHRKPSRVQTH
jgi:hypothetical protein